MGRITRVLLWIGVSVLLSASSCTPAEGTPCAKRDDTYTLESKVVLKCVVRNNELIWQPS